LAIAKTEGFECFALSVAYGQRHASEILAASRVAEALGATEHRVMRVDLADIGGSALTDPEIAVPESPGEGIPVTYVPARNTIMLSLALAWAEVLNAEAVFIGVNARDYSVAGNTKVWIRSSSEPPRLMPIEAVYSLPDDSYQTIGVDLESLELQWREVQGRFKHRVNGKRCYRIRLERGQQIEVSEDHSLFTIGDDGSIQTIRGDEIAVGTPLVAPFDLRAFADSWQHDLQHLHLRTPSPDDSSPRRSSVTADAVFLTNRLNRTRVPMDLPVTDDFLRVIGLWLAEGGKDPNSKSRALAFSIGGLEGAPALLERYFGGFGLSVHKSPANRFDYRVESSVMYEVFRQLDLIATARSGQKRFPPWFWNLSQRQRRVMVAAFWDGDGGHVWNGEAPISQKSHELILDLYHCLLLDGVFATVKRAAHGQLRLAITRASDLAEFANLYPLWHASKLASLTLAGKTKGRDKTTGLWKCDGIWAAVAAAGLAPGRKTQIYNSGGKYDEGVRAQRSAFAGITSLDPLVRSKLAFLRVTSMEPVAHEFMYDLSVDGAENFLANGLLAHNSGYPDCRPEFIESFNRLAALATKSGVEGRATRIRAPLIDMTKADIVRRGTTLGVDYKLTVSCYQADEDGYACGRCDSCRLRRAGFEDAGVPDPTRYR
jgi:7-cyano-7-deazaguanine synthase in queuosine biosynthesis